MQTPGQMMQVVVLMGTVAAFGSQAYSQEFKTSPQARDIFAAKCLHCHDNTGKLPFLTDGAELDPRYVGKTSLRPMVIPGDVEGSKLWQVLQPTAHNRMPKDGDYLDSAEIDTLVRWIRGDALNPTDDSNSLQCSTAAAYTLEELAEIAARDLVVTTPDPDQRRFYRYFIAPQAVGCNVSSGNFWGLVSFMLNSLSWNNEVIPVEPLNDFPDLLARVDLRNYLPSQNSRFSSVDSWGNPRGGGNQPTNFSTAWESALADRYPYKPKTEQVDEFNRSRRQTNAPAPVLSAYERLVTATGSKLPLMRADWFVANAMTPAFYYPIMGVPAENAGVADWLQRNILATDESSLRDRRTNVRAGITESGVSTQNRAFERLPSVNGGYWKSFDFLPEHDVSAREARRDIMEEPNNLTADASEIIFQLPNGLFGYLLRNRAGDRADSAPTAIVRDRVRGSDIIAGSSCLSCHMSQGLIPKRDQVADYWQKTRFAERGTPIFTAVMAVFNSRRLMRFLQNDNQLYWQAFEDTGASHESLDLYFKLQDDYAAVLPKDRVFRELGVTEGEYMELFYGVPADRKVVMECMRRLQYGSLTRAFFERSYGEVEQYMRQARAKQAAPAGAGAPVKTGAIQQVPPPNAVPAGGDIESHRGGGVVDISF